MRRLLVLSGLIGAVAVLALGGSAANARQHRGSTSLIACPLATSTVTPPCCGPPIESPDRAVVDGAQQPRLVPGACCPVEAASTLQPICCATVTPCSTVSISASPNPADGSQQVTVSGSVAGGTAGASVDLWEERAGARAFSDVGSTTIQPDDSYSMTAPGTVSTNRQWYVTSGGVQSSTIAEQVSARITLLVHRRTHSSTVHGAVTPSHAGERVLLQRKARGKWVTLTRPKLSKRSRFGVHYRGRPTIRATLRVVFPGDSTNARSVSRPVTAVVLPGA